MCNKIKSVKITDLEINQRFAISKNGAPCISIKIYKGAFFGFAYAETLESAIPEVYNEYTLVYPLSKTCL